MANDKSIHEKRFEAAVKIMKSLPEDGPFQPSDNMLNMFYGYYKQATAGPCDAPKPGFWDSTGQAKWEAWKALGDMPKEKAMMEYVQEIQLILETIPLTEDVADLLEALGSFYEVVEDDEINGEVEFHSAVAETTLSRPMTNTKADDNDGKASKEGDDEEEDESESFEGDVTEDDTGMEMADSVDTPVDLTRHRVEDCFLRGGTQTPSSVSSLTTATHSSLNSQEEEEELAFIRDGSSLHNDESEAATVLNPEAAPAEEEPMAPPLKEEVKTGSEVPRVCLAESKAARANGPDSQGENSVSECESLDGTLQGHIPLPPGLGTVRPDRISSRTGRVSKSESTDPVTQSDLLGCCGNSPRQETTGDVGGGTLRQQDVNTRVSMALLQLQEDMQNVLDRLNSLEALTSTQHGLLTLRHDNYPSFAKKMLSWWPFELSPITVTLAVVWPFVTHWLAWLYRQRRQRCIVLGEIISLL
ncbi:acyl-CoA-binding domain-containing protein 5-B [Chanos chanos]|uniref:Acyl-CoA-binding domain-containing protein 5 n=1 Tax=Chanos chanos TaxID=29144 RepID=A0A6J2VFD5_CHACN|nr:acyl-CoA-binding domain-containing protein 5-B-like [Chanos chanos]